MISSAVAFAFLIAAPLADPTAAPRRDFDACLESFLRSNLEKKTAPQAFNEALRPKCADKEAAFRKAMVAADVAAGIDRAEAEEMVAEDIEASLSDTRDRYKDYIDTNTRPAD